MQHQDKKYSILTLAIGAIIISFSSVIVKLSDVDPSASGFYRVFFATIVLLVYVIIKKDKLWHSRKYLFLSIFCGFIFTADLFFWHRSIHYIGPGLATIIGNFEVFILAIIGIFFLKEKVKINLILSIPVAFVGLFMLVGVNWTKLQHLYKIGVYFGLITTIFYAIYLLILKKLQSLKNCLTPMANLTNISIFATFFFALVIIISDKSTFTIPHTKSLILLLSYSVCCQIIGWVLIIKSLPKVDISMAGLILLLQPALSFIWDILFFDMQLNTLRVIGAFLALGAIYFGSTDFKKNKRRN